MPRCWYFLRRARCRVVTSGEGLFTGVAGRNLIVNSGEDPLIGDDE